MPEYREVVHQRLYLKEPRTERLRKTAAGWLQYMLSIGWRETDRSHANDYVTVKLERTGHPPLAKMPKIEPAPPRQSRGGFGQGGPGGGPRR
jgi:hypothetical protein